MMRSLWTAASGMTSQQLNVDNISNNLANVNTTGFKKERIEFKSLLYQTMNRATQDEANTGGRPVNLQVGHGVRPMATMRSFAQGSMQATENPLDFVIQGDGFFQVATSGDRILYSRDGSFKVSNDGAEYSIVTSDGYQILGVDGQPLRFSNQYEIASLNVGADGVIFAFDGNETIDTGLQIELVQFPNTQGLEAIGDNFYAETPASGQPLFESEGEVQVPSKLVQGFLEMSNVQVAQEMVNLIIAQRAYELNSKAITTSDEMLQNANNLKR